MNSHKWYVGMFWDAYRGCYRMFAVNYSDGIPVSARNVRLVWAVSAQKAQALYSVN